MFRPVLFLVGLLASQAIAGDNDTHPDTLNLCYLLGCPKPTTSIITSTATATSTTTMTKTVTFECSSAPTSSSTLKPFKCTTNEIILLDRKLYSVDPKTGNRTVISSAVGGSGPTVNSIGYNPLDNYIYGNQGTSVVRLGADGALETVVVLGKISPFAGDVDEAGQYYYTAGGKAWGRVDLKLGSRTYGKVVEQGVSEAREFPRGAVAADWASSPAFPGYMYSVVADLATKVPMLVRWSTQTHKWEIVYAKYAKTALRGAAFGAVSATKDGVLYALDAATGMTLRVPLANPANATKTGVGPTGASSDGTRCAALADAE